VVPVTWPRSMLSNRLVERDDARGLGVVRTDVQDLGTGPFCPSFVSHCGQASEALLRLRCDDRLLDERRIDRRELHNHRPPAPLVAIGLIHASLPRGDAFHDCLSVGALDPPQRLERHHAGRTARGLPQREVDAVAD
jgi:hypothetical protein